MNENLEVRVEKLTDVIKNLSNNQGVCASDLDDILNNIVSKVDESNSKTADMLQEQMQLSIKDMLDAKNGEIKEKLNLIENFVSLLSENLQNSELKENTQKILNDLEVIHSKLNDEQSKLENLASAINSSDGISKEAFSAMCDDIGNISSGFNSIINTLNNNFEEFLKKVEQSGSREEFGRVRNYLENIDGSQNTLLTAITSLNRGHDEIKDLVKQSVSAQATEKLEQFQNILSQLAKASLETTSKADLEVVSDKITTVVDILNEFRRSVDENNSEDIKTIFQNQLNSIIGTLEGLKLNTNSEVGEDIIRLYTSIAEFKDSAYSAIDSKLNDVIASIDARLDKITGSLTNISADTSESVNNIASGVQRLNELVVDGINTRTSEIKDELQKTNSESVLQIVNSIKNELTLVRDELASINSADSQKDAASVIESLKENFNFDKLNAMVSEIKENINFEPVEKKIELLNNRETLDNINSCLNAVLENLKSNEILAKLDNIEALNNVEDIYTAVNSIKENLDFDGIKGEISNLKEYLNSLDFKNELSTIKENLSSLETISEEIISIKNLDGRLNDIKNRIEENFRLYSDKISEDDDLKSEIKEALTTIYDCICACNTTENSNKSVTEINEKLEEILKQVSLPADNSALEASIDNLNSSMDANLSKLQDAVLDSNSSIEENCAKLHEKFDSFDINLKNTNEEIFEKMKNEVSSLGELFKSITSNSLGETVENLKASILQNGTENLSELKSSIILFKDNIFEFLNDLNDRIDALKNDSANSDMLKSSVSDIKNVLTEGINSINSLIDDKAYTADEKMQERLLEVIDSIKSELKTQVSDLTEQINTTHFKEIENLVKCTLDDVKNELLENLKQKASAVAAIVQESKQSSSVEIVSKIQDIITKFENSPERTGLFEKITANLGETLDNSIATRNSVDGNELVLLNLKEDIQDFIDDTKDDFDALKASVTSGFSEAFEANKANAEDAKNVLAAIEQTLKDKFTAADTKISEAVKSLEDSILDSVLKSKDDIYSFSKENARDLLEGIKNEFSMLVTNDLPDNIKLEETKDTIIQSLTSFHDEKLADLQNKIKEYIDLQLDENKTSIETKFEQKTDEITSALSGEFAKNSNDINNKINEYIVVGSEVNNNVLKLNSIKDDVAASSVQLFDDITKQLTELSIKNMDEIKEEFGNGANSIVDKLRDEIEQINSAIKDKTTQDKEDASSLMGFANLIEQKIQNKISAIEILIDDCVSKIDSKTSETLNSANDEYSKRIEARLDELTDALKDEFNSKIADIQKIVDDKVYEIVSRNNDIIKDELKLRSDSTIREIIDELKEGIQIRNDAASYKESEPSQSEETYTLADVESDIAKIRLGLEKQNKLSNFKEFAARLVELKNINLENAKISRVIGADIMRFDSWLKNATAKIDVLASKIEKSEKIKMEDLKTRLIQSEKNQTMPQKFEEALMGIYKKYRLQETKIEDMIAKLEALSQKEDERLDIKEFIDIMYDNNSKTQNMVARIDGLEDKMDLIQAKIDHIISSCFGE